MLFQILSLRKIGFLRYEKNYFSKMSVKFISYEHTNVYEIRRKIVSVMHPHTNKYILSNIQEYIYTKKKPHLIYIHSKGNRVN